jgi:hypothetical protein
MTPTPDILELPIERLFAIDWHVWRALEWARVERGVVR